MKYKQQTIRFLKKIWITFVLLFVLFAIFFSIFRALTPWAKQYKVQIEQQLSGFLGQPVRIGDLQTSWYWFQPVLKMQDVRLSDGQHRQMMVNQLLVGVNLWRSLWSWQIKPGVLYVHETTITLNQVSDTRWDIEGLQPNQAVTSIDNKAYLPVIAWLLSQDTVMLNHVAINLHLQDGTVLPLKQVNLKMRNNGGHIRLSGHAELAKETPSLFSWAADLNIHPENVQALSGHVYFSATDFIPSSWQSLLPDLPIKVNQGVCDLKSWIDLNEGKLTNVQSVIRLKDFSWTEIDSKKMRKLDALSANFIWKRVAKRDWHLAADHLALRLNGVDWPENNLQLDYTQSNETYALFVKHILLSSLNQADIPWPDSMQHLMAMEPEGDLLNTQVTINHDQVTYVLTRFADLGWQMTPSIPAINHLSGAIYWQPNEGRLILDGEQTTLVPQKLPPLTFNLLNTDLSWKALSNGYRISMDRFVLTQPNLVLSANGVLDNPQTNDARLQLSAEFSAKNAKKFLAYLPSTWMKDKLDAWLKHDIKRIGSASGRVLFDGKLADFPFDNQPGEFSVVSHLSGVDLLINADWPLNRDIDADLLVDKRSLVANIDQANLDGVLINKLNLSVPNIGLGQESLLIHGQIEAPGEQIKHYVFATPMRDRLSRWRPIEVNEDLNLDLRLDIPLYPESDHVVVLGELIFDQNPITIHFPMVKLNIEQVDGSLHFNEYGLTDGELRGELDGSPVSLRAQALIQPKEGAVLSIEGQASLDYLRKTLDLPWLKLISGQLNAAALWTIYANENEADALHIDSSLKGVAIDLPKPLGKVEQDLAPLTVDVHFSPQNSLHVQLDYNHQLTSDVFLNATDKQYSIAHGYVELGEPSSPPAQINQHLKGLRISGHLPEADLSRWHSTWDSLTQNHASRSSLDVIHDVDLNIKKVYFLDQKYLNMSINMHRVSHDDWALKIDQAEIAGRLHYLPSKQMLSGEIQRLYLKQPSKTQVNKHHVTKYTLKPKDIPNLSLSVKDFKIHDIDVGEVNIKSNSSPTTWTLNECIIGAPEYRLNLQGEWRVLEASQQSMLMANLEVKDLSKGLERWHIKPVVNAHHGKMSFKGKWDGAFYDFSLGGLSGDMDLVLRNGRISHFDKATEEKLGLGKLLSILSLQTIPRRLQLDFSDLSEGGYSFDVFKGSFQINQGVMSTHDSYIDGPVAYAKMSGDLDLINHLYDMSLRITPYITASLPVVATIAGGPIAGVATWVASNLINKGMQQISGYTYKISGPWLDPVVQQVIIERK